MRSLLFYFSFSSLLFRIRAIELKIFDNLLEVRSQNGLFFPLCSKSFHQKYGEQACASISSVFSSHTTVSLEQYTYSIGCVSSACFTFLSSFCTTGVKVFCSSSLCPSGTLQIGEKCLSISSIPVQGYSEAKDYCAPFSLISSLNLNEIESIRKATVALITADSPRLFFTSGLREGSTWKWSNGEPIDQEIKGNGRCLAFQSEKNLVAIDCDSNAYVFCESGRECVENHKVYSGSANKTADGRNCLRWDDPSVLFQRDVDVEIFNHNFCKFVEQNGKKSSIPMCYVKSNQLAECNIPNCPKSQNVDSRDSVDTCPLASFSCDNGSKCISDNFRCDYEVDCIDGSDENNCDDYLQYYELIGAYWIVENVIEVWKFIPHVQGCARKCRESLLMCEAFSYEPKTQTCLLTDTSHVFSSLARKITSLYYRRRFSSKDVLFEVENKVLYATKSAKKAHVCNENYSRDKLSSICRVLGFGDPIYTRGSRQFDASLERQRPPLSPRPSSDSSSASSSPIRHLVRRSATLALHLPVWNLSCLREPNCTSTIVSTCQPIRCSSCQHAACGDGKCIKFHQLCDGHVDCSSGDDELDCRGESFRLTNGSDTSGYVEVLFRAKWEPLCADQLDGKKVNSMCDIMRLGERGSSLSTNISISSGFDVQCGDTDCTIRRSSICSRQARISCTSKNGVSSLSQCGRRYVEVNARDAARSRIARVVGGFETVPGAFPWTAALRIKATKAHHCGASILDETHLITAAHCFEEDERVSSYEVVVGEWDNNVTDGSEQIFPLQRIHFYPLYKDIFSHDIAILEIPPPGIQFDEYAQPICLPTNDFVYTPGRQCVVSGWGSMGLRYAQRLQAALIPIIDRAECVNSSQIYASMSRSAFCAGYLEGGIDSCQGDSGGPLSCRREDGAFVLAGVISWGDGCAQKKQPGIYTMVAPYLSWINSIVMSSTAPRNRRNFSLVRLPG